MTPPPPKNMRKWILLIFKHVDKSLLREIVAGGSRAREPAVVGADTDLFIGVTDGATFVAADELRAKLARTSSEYVISTLSYRPDFGLRVRIAKSPIDCCSYFFYDRPMVRNVVHWRRGVRLWTDNEQGEIHPTNESIPFDEAARKEELADGLLEIPSALKYLSREDYLPASIRLDRAILCLVNVVTLDPNKYLSGSDKELAERLGGRIGQLPPRANLIFEPKAATLQHILQVQINFILALLDEALQIFDRGPYGIASGHRYLMSTIHHLTFWQASLSTRVNSVY